MQHWGGASLSIISSENGQTERDQVFRYAVLVTDAVIPASLWGSDFNYKLVKQRAYQWADLGTR